MLSVSSKGLFVRSKLSVLITLLFLGLGLVSCGGGGEQGHETSDIPADAGFNQADVDFATDMIQHHAQALLMVDLMNGRKVSPELDALAEQIRMVQGPEIESLVDWLTEWDQPVPETSRDHANAHGGGMEMDSDMPGMMSHEEMQALEDAGDAEFEPMWLEMMIKHHEGAVEMAGAEKRDGKYADAVQMAASIVSGQEDEIATMKDMLSRS